jgi:hypothetical protein
MGKTALKAPENGRFAPVLSLPSMAKINFLRNFFKKIVAYVERM